MYNVLSCLPLKNSIEKRKINYSCWVWLIDCNNIKNQNKILSDFLLLFSGTISTVISIILTLHDSLGIHIYIPVVVK
jgi:hypothetical protein